MSRTNRKNEYVIVDEHSKWGAFSFWRNTRKNNLQRKVSLDANDRMVAAFLGIR